MRFYTHIAFGLFFSGFIISSWSPLLFCLVVFFSVLPDIDHPYSFIGQLFPRLSRWLFNQCGHRGLVHSVYVPVSLILDFFLFKNYIALVVSTAYTSHIILDMFTRSGVKLFSPLSWSFILLDGDLESSNLKSNLLISLGSIIGFTAWLFRDYLVSLIL